MKKFIIFLLTLIFLVSLCGCTSKETTKENVNEVAKEEQSAQVKEEKPSAVKEEVPVKAEKKEETEKKEAVKTEKAVKKEEVKKEEEKVSPVTEHTKSFFNSVPEKFTYSDGSGKWKTELIFKEDGTFTGKYTDTSAEGTVKICDFSGKLSQPIPLDDCTFISMMEKIETKEAEGTTLTKDGVKYVYTAPYGLENVQEMIFHKPGAAASILTDELLNCIPNKEKIKDTIPENMFLLCNLKDMTAFVGKN